MSSELCAELLRLIEHQGEIIAKLTNENNEQENFINAMLKDDLCS